VQKRNIPFKINNQQAMLLPTDLDELIEDSHPVRVINSVLDSLDIDKIITK
jgi:transposase